MSPENAERIRRAYEVFNRLGWESARPTERHTGRAWRSRAFTTRSLGFGTRSGAPFCRLRRP